MTAMFVPTQYYQPVAGNTATLLNHSGRGQAQCVIGYHASGLLAGQTHNFIGLAAQDVHGNGGGFLSVGRQDSGGTHLFRTWYASTQPFIFQRVESMTETPRGCYVSEWNAANTIMKGSASPWPGGTRSYANAIVCIGCDAQVKNINAPLTAGQVAYTCGFRPKALLMFTSPINSAGSYPSNSRNLAETSLGWGAATGADQWCLYSATAGAVATTGASRLASKLGIIDDNSGNNRYEISLVSLDANGYTLDWTINGSAIAYRCLVVALGGNDAGFSLQKSTVPTSTSTTNLDMGMRLRSLDDSAFHLGTCAMVGHIASPNSSATGQSYQSTQVVGFDPVYDKATSSIGMNHNAAVDHSTRQRAYHLFNRTTQTNGNRGQVKVYSWLMNTLASGYASDDGNTGLEIEWTTVDGNAYEYFALAMGEFSSRNGWTDRGRLRALQRIHDGTALPGNYYLMLCTDANVPGPDTVTFSELTEIGTGNGYPSGGYDVQIDSNSVASQASNNATISLPDITITATGALPSSGDPIRHMVLTDNNVTLADREVYYFWDMDHDEVLRNGDQLVLKLSTDIRERT